MFALGDLRLNNFLLEEPDLSLNQVVKTDTEVLYEKTLATNRNKLQIRLFAETFPVMEVTFHVY